MLRLLVLSPGDPESNVWLQERADRDSIGQRPVAIIDDGCGGHRGHVTPLVWKVRGK